MATLSHIVQNHRTVIMQKPPYPPIISVEKEQGYRKRPAQEFYLLISIILHGRNKSF